MSSVKNVQQQAPARSDNENRYCTYKHRLRKIAGVVAEDLVGRTVPALLDVPCKDDVRRKKSWKKHMEKSVLEAAQPLVVVCENPDPVTGADYERLLRPLELPGSVLAPTSYAELKPRHWPCSRDPRRLNLCERLGYEKDLVKPTLVDNDIVPVESSHLPTLVVDVSNWPRSACFYIKQVPRADRLAKIPLKFAKVENDCEPLDSSVEIAELEGDSSHDEDKNFQESIIDSFQIEYSNTAMDRSGRRWRQNSADEDEIEPVKKIKMTEPSTSRAPEPTKHHDQRQKPRAAVVVDCIDLCEEEEEEDQEPVSLKAESADPVDDDVQLETGRHSVEYRIKKILLNRNSVDIVTLDSDDDDDAFIADVIANVAASEAAAAKPISSEKHVASTSTSSAPTRLLNDSCDSGVGLAHNAHPTHLSEESESQQQFPETVTLETPRVLVADREAETEPDFHHFDQPSRTVGRDYETTTSTSSSSSEDKDTRDGDVKPKVKTIDRSDDEIQLETGRHSVKYRLKKMMSHPCAGVVTLDGDDALLALAMRSVAIGQDTENGTVMSDRRCTLVKQTSATKDDTTDRQRELCNEVDDACAAEAGEISTCRGENDNRDYHEGAVVNGCDTLASEDLMGRVPSSMQIDESNEQCVPDLLSRADELADEFMRDMIEEARETERRIEQLQLAVWPSSGKVTSKSKRSSVVNWLFKCQIVEEEEAVGWRGVNKRKNDNDYDDGSETGSLLRMEKRRKTEEKEEVVVAEKSVDAQREIRTTVEKEVAVFSTNLALQPAAGSPLDLTEMIRRLVQCARSAQHSRMSIDFCLRVDPSITLFRFMQLHQRVMSNVFWHTRFNHWCKDNNPLQQTSSAKITDLSNTDSNKGLLRNEEFPKVSDPKVVISFPAQTSKANRPKQNKSDQEPRGYNYVRNPPLLSARKESYDMQPQKSVESVKKLQFPMLKKDCYKPKVSITLNKYLFDPIEKEVPELEGDFQNQPVNFHNSNLENCLGPGVKKMVKRTPLSDVTSEDLNLGSLCLKPTKLTSINKTIESNSETTPLSSTEITKISLPVSLPIDEISPNTFFYSLPQYSYSDDFNNDFHSNRQVTYGRDGSNAYNYSSDEECPPQNKACSPIVESENVNEKTINSVSNIKQQNKENSADKQGEESINNGEEISKSDCVLAENRCKKINEQYITTNKSDEVVNENDDSNDDNFDNMVLVLSSTTSDDNSDFEHNKENIVEIMHQDTEESTTNLDSDNIAYVKDKNMNEKKSMADIVQQENVSEPSKLSHSCEPPVDPKAEAKSLKLVIVRNGSTEKWGIKRKTSSETDSLSDKSLTKKSSPPETAVTEHVSEPVLHRDVEMAVNTVNTEDNHVLENDTQVALENSLCKDAEMGTTTIENVSECNSMTTDGGKNQLIPSLHRDVEMAINTVNTEDNHVLAKDTQVAPENSLYRDIEMAINTINTEDNHVLENDTQVALENSLHKDAGMGTTTTTDNVSECNRISTDGDQNQLKPSLHKDAEMDESATVDECNYVIADDIQVVPDNEDHLEGGDFDFVNEITYDSDHDSYMCDNSSLKESEAVMECVTFTNAEKSHEDEDIIFLEAKTSKPMVVNKHIHQMKSEEITLETFNELNLHKSIVAPETAKEESNNDITNEEQEVFKKSLNALMNDVVLRDADSTVDNNNEILTCSKLTSAQLNIFQAYNITVVDDLENFPNKVYGKNNAVHPPVESIPVQPPVQPTIRVRNMNELLAKPNDIPISSDCTAENNNLTVQATPINVITAPQTNILVPHVPAQASKVIVASQLYANMFDMPGSNEHSTSNVPKNQPTHNYDIFSLPLRPYEYFQLPEPCSIYAEDSEDVKLAKVRKYQKALQKKIREAVQYFQMNKNLVVQSIDSFLHYKTLNMNNVYFHQYLNSYFQCFCAIRRISGYTTTNFIMWVMINTLENSPDGCIFFSKANSFVCMSQLCQKMGGHAFISNYENEPFLEDLDNEYMHRNQPNQILMMSQEQKKVFFKQVAMYRKIVGLL